MSRDSTTSREKLAIGWKEYLESHGAGQAGADGVPKQASLTTLVTTYAWSYNPCLDCLIQVGGKPEGDEIKKHVLCI